VIQKTSDGWQKEAEEAERQKRAKNKRVGKMSQK